MNEESRLLALIWDAIGDCIPSSDKQEAANALVEAFVEGGHEVVTLFDAEGECLFLDKALDNTHAKIESGCDEEDEIDLYDDGF